MRIAMFYHSLLSDWNHGNAHFLRGVATELQERGHTVQIYEPRSAWSLTNLVAQFGRAPIREFRRAYPHLTSRKYVLREFDFTAELGEVDLVIAHEWNDAHLVHQLGKHRRRLGYRLLFHDTHHRSVTAPKEMAGYDLSRFDGVLAFGEVVRRIYLQKGWARRAWTWHEAADTRLFHPNGHIRNKSDLVWIGNWGDDERTAELREFLLGPVKSLQLRAVAHGVRYPSAALKTLQKAGIEYKDWLPNYKVPHVFARHRLTVHIPRRPYTRALPGIPTIRVFEALACGIPLVSSPWRDSEHLFTPGQDFLIARNGREMRRHIRMILNEPLFAQQMAASGVEAVRRRHTCAHRTDELMQVCAELGLGTGTPVQLTLRLAQKVLPSVGRLAGRVARHKIEEAVVGAG